MASIRLSKEEKEQIVSAKHPAPRSILGFHEVLRSDGRKAWVIRALELKADAAMLFWEDQKAADATLMKQIHPDGLFEIVMDPRPHLYPYKLKFSMPEGEIIRYDPFYFLSHISGFDCHLFAEGNHHQIYRKMGAHPVEIEGVAGTRFAVWAPNAKRVSVVGPFNDWNGNKNSMHPIDTTGIWELFIPEILEGTLYKYEINGPNEDLHLKSDPYGFQMETRPANASVVTSLDGYEWNDQTWMEQRNQQKPTQLPVSVYEVHLGSWKRVPEDNDRSLTYREAADELIPYVKDMQYTHIELMPLAEHPLDASWGYQVTGYFAATSRFGTPKDLMYFIDRCHQEGIGVILDWVPGHFPKDANGLAYFDGTHLYEHADWRKGEHKEWGTLVFNYGRNEVRNFLIANALFWYDYYHIDGIRVDAVASMLYLDYNRKDGEWIANQYGGNENLEAIDFMRSLSEAIFHYYPGTLSIAEESTAWSGVSHPPYVGGLGFNFKWNMGWMNDTLRYMSLDPIYRKYEQNLLTFSLIYAFSENFILSLSHDEVVHGKRSLLDKMPGDFWQKRANFRLYMAFQTTHPGKQLNFMGSEFGQWKEWSEAASLEWHLLEYEEHRQIQDFCRELNRLYRSHPALYSNDFDWSGFEWIDLHDHENSVISYLRKSAVDVPAPSIICVFNFTPVPRKNYSVGVPDAGEYVKLLDSDDPRFGGSGFNQALEVFSDSTTCQGRSHRIVVDLPPLGCLLFYRKEQ